MVKIDVPKAPAVMRAKFDRPEALGIIAGGNPTSVIATSGTKKHATAAPCTIVGTISVNRSTSVLNCERM